MLLKLVARSRSNWAEGRGLDWVGRCAFDLGCGIGGNVMNDGKYKSVKKDAPAFSKTFTSKNDALSKAGSHYCSANAISSIAL